MDRKKIIDRINGSRHFSGLSPKISQDFLNNLFEYDLGRGSEEQYQVKENLLYVLKVIFADEMGLKINQISYRIKNLGDNTSAQIEDNLGYFKFRITIDQEFFEFSTIQDFMFSILHEYGHINQIIQERKGVVVPQSIGILDHKVAILSEWQQKGVLYKYFANKNELDANSFATKKMVEFINRSKTKKPCYYRFKTKLSTITKYARKKVKFVTCKFKYKCWKMVNRVIKQEENDATIVENVSVTLADKIYQNNLAKKFDCIDFEEAKQLLECVEATKNYENLSSEDKASLAISCADLKTIIMANELGIDAEQLGVMFLDVFNKPFKFIKTNGLVNKTPISGFFAINESELVKLSNFQKVLSELNKETKFAKSILRNQITSEEELC